MLRLFKPKWQHPNPKVRIKAINNRLGQETILLLAKTDLETAVRIRAIQEVLDLHDLHALTLCEPCQEAKVSIYKTIIDRLVQHDNPRNIIQEINRKNNRSEFPIVELLTYCDNDDLKKLFFSLLDRESTLDRLIKKQYVFSIEEVKLLVDINLLEYLYKKGTNLDKQVMIYLKEKVQLFNQEQYLDDKKTELLERYRALLDSDELPALNLYSNLETEWRKFGFGNENQQYQQHYLEKYNAINHDRQEKLQWISEFEKSYRTKQFNSNEIEFIRVKLLELQDDKVLSLRERSNARELLRLLEIQRQKYAKDKENYLASKRVIQGAKRLLKQEHYISEGLLERSRKSVAALALNIEGRTEILKQLARRLEEEAKRKSFDSQEFEKKLEIMKNKVANGDLKSAKADYQTLYEMLKSIKSKDEFRQYRTKLNYSANDLQDQLTNARWASLRVLEELCNQAEALRVSDHNIEYLSVTLTQMRQDWQNARSTLVKVPVALIRRFENACQIIYKKITGARAITHAERQVYIDEANVLLSSLQDIIQKIDWESSDWTSLASMRSEFLKNWNLYLNQQSTEESIGVGQPLFLIKDKKILEKKMQEYMLPLNEKLKEKQMQENIRKENLLNELESVLKNGDIKIANTKLREVGNQFNSKIALTKSQENILWKRFKTLRNEIRSQLSEKNNLEQEKSAEILCSFLEKMTALSQSLLEANELRLALDDIEKDRKQVDITVDRGRYTAFMKDYNQQLNNIKELIKSRQRQELSAERKKLFEISQIIAQKEESAVTNNKIDIDNLVQYEHYGQFKKRLKVLHDVATGSEQALELLRNKHADRLSKAFKLVLLRDILLGNPGEHAEKEQRMALQLELMENRMMAGKFGSEQNEELRILDEKWFEDVVGIVSDELFSRFFK